MSHERERNAALRIARNRARAGDELAADRWLRVAAEFAEPSERQLRSYQDAILAGRRAFIHAGQMKLET